MDLVVSNPEVVAFGGNLEQLSQLVALNMSLRNYGEAVKEMQVFSH